MRISRDAVIGIICRGGPVNGPFSASALHSLLDRLHCAGMHASHLYGNSASVPATVMSSIGKSADACAIWTSLTPDDIVTEHRDWSGRFRTAWRLLRSEAIFDDTPLEHLIRSTISRAEVFAESAIPLKLMTVDYLTGKQMVANNKNPNHRGNWYGLMLGSMALTPFLKPQIIYDTVDSDLLATPYTRVGWLKDIAIAIDGGYSDNLMLDSACCDGNTVVFVVDINGLELGPLDTYRWDFWANTLQRAFHILVTTNDQRHLAGVQRGNEALWIRDQLLRISESADERTATEITQLVMRMDDGILNLARKRSVQIIPVSASDCSRPFDFATFTKDETMHLLHCGERAVQRVFEGLVIS